MNFEKWQKDVALCFWLVCVQIFIVAGFVLLLLAWQDVQHKKIKNLEQRVKVLEVGR